MGEANHVSSLGGSSKKSSRNEPNQVPEGLELCEHGSATETVRREGPFGSIVSEEEQIQLTPLPSKHIRIFQSINLNMASISLVSP